MAFDIDRARLIDGARAGSRRLAETASQAWGWARGEAARAWPAVARLVRSQPLVRYLAGSLWRRIIFSNLVGLTILVIGFLYSNQYKDWLIDAKVDSLTAQGQIIAQAIAGNATLVGQRIEIDPDALPEGSGSLAPLRDDGFAALSFSIGPEKITPVLRRLLQPGIRARVFDRDGLLIVDSNRFLARGKLDDAAATVTSQSRPKTKDVWTRLTQLLYAPDLPVLNDLDQNNGHYYPPVRAAMGGKGMPMLLLNEEGQQIVSYAAPIQRASQINGVLMLSTEPGEIETVIAKERNAILVLALLALVAAVAVSVMLAYAVATPIRRLSAAADAVSHNINARDELPDFSDRTDEVGQLAAAFAAMTASLHRRIEASEKFAADVAHELKNPLTAARSTAESLSYAKTDEQREQLVQQIQLELKRLNRMITDVSNASRLEAELALQEREPVDLAKLLDGVVAMFRDIHSDDARLTVLEVDPQTRGQLVVMGHEGRLGQVITNLLDNALSFSPDDGTVWVKARRDRDAVEITVEDEGPGIDPAKLETIFQRFYTYRPTANSSRGNNSGLGLSITREIVASHRGRVWAENRRAPGASPDSAPIGARFIVRLPAAPEKPVASGLSAKLPWRG